MFGAENRPAGSAQTIEVVSDRARDVALQSVDVILRREAEVGLGAA